MDDPQFRLFAFRQDWPADEWMVKVIEEVTAEIYGAAGEIQVVYLDDGDNIDRVLATPLLVQLSPPPKQYFVGNLSDAERLRRLLSNNEFKKKSASARMAADGVQPVIE